MFNKYLKNILNPFFNNKIILEDIEQTHLAKMSNQVILFSGVLGALYGILIYPMWIENIEFGS